MFVRWCVVEFLAHNVSHGMSGACASRGSSLLGPFSWGNNKYSRSIAQNKRTSCPGCPAADTDDFLAIPSSLHKCIQARVTFLAGAPRSYGSYGFDGQGFQYLLVHIGQL